MKQFHNANGFTSDITDNSQDNLLYRYKQIDIIKVNLYKIPTGSCSVNYTVILEMLVTENTEQ